MEATDYGLALDPGPQQATCPYNIHQLRGQVIFLASAWITDGQIGGAGIYYLALLHLDSSPALANRWEHLSEQIEHLQRIQVVHGLPVVLFYPTVFLLRFIKGLVKKDFGLWENLSSQNSTH